MQTLIPEKTIYLIDGSSFLYRAFYAIKPMTAAGVQVGAVFGFCRSLRKLLDTFNPQHVALVWDTKGPTQRHEMYTEYKATRQASPHHLYDQKLLIQEFATAIQLKQVEKAGFEADDLIYSLTRDFEKKGYKIVILTGDKDLGQIVNDDIVLYDQFKELLVTQEDLEKKYGFPLEKLRFYFSLVGDSSDNIPGVKGIGPKGATELVVQFASLQDLYDNIDSVKKERTRQLLIAGKEDAFLSEKLFSLSYYATHISLSDIAFHESSWQYARNFFERYQFKSLLKDMGVAVVNQLPHVQADFKIIATEKELHELINKIHAHGAFAFDTETNGAPVMQALLVGISIAYQQGVSFYIPLNHEEKTELPAENALAALKPLFENETIKKYAHHAKFDMHALATRNIDTKNVSFDTLIAASLLRHDGDRIGLKTLSQTYFNEQMLSFDDVVTHKGRKTFADVPLNEAVMYACADAHQTFKLVHVLTSELAEQQQDVLFYTIEMPLMRILYEMEERGIYCDASVLREIGKLVSRDIERVHDAIIDLIGHQFFAINLNSHVQLKELLFDHLRLTPLKKTTGKTGYSTDQEVLLELADQHPVPALIIKYRELVKLKNTYIEGLLAAINPQTGRIHTTFSQTIVATGRLSSSDPNLQNIPTASLDQRLQIRSAFKAEKGRVFISVDYSQIELRVVAYLSQDASLIRAFNNNADIHTHTAARIFDVPDDQVTHEQRQVGKRINFSILYGLTPYGLSKDLKISLSEAKKYIDRYYEQHPGLVAWMDTIVEEAKKTGYVQTLWGRRRYVSGIHERNKHLFEAARRIVVNTQAQGTTAELMKIGMIKVQEALNVHRLDARMLLQIHDELLFSVIESQQEVVQDLLVDVLQNVVNWNIPLVVKTSVGTTWDAVSK